MKLIDLTDQKFGRLTVKKIAYRKRSKSGRQRIYWECLCDCGKITIKVGDNIKSGRSKSCGCYHLESIKKTNTKHGKTDTNEYNIWLGIKQRCLDKNSESYKDYGGRGIKMCERWLESFENFYDDMGPRPSKRHSIDRIDNEGDYTPENCHWATKLEQANNTRSNRFIKIDGVEKTLAQWCRFYDITYGIVECRIRRGWPIEKAIKTEADFKLDIITFNGETKHLTQWAKDLGINRGTLYGRIYDLGWPIEKAFTAPLTEKQSAKINGVTKTMKQWCDFYKIDYGVFRMRTHRGWSIHKALTTPVKSPRKK